MAGINALTVLMLHCNGTDGSPVFTDEIGHTVTPNGSVQIDTAQSVFGGASGLFDGSSSCQLTIADSPNWDFGSGDFTIDFRFRPADTSGTKAIISQWAGGGSGASFYLDQEGTTIKFYYNAGAGEVPLTSTIFLTANNWYHIAVMRSGNTLYFFQDGVLSGTADMTGVTIFDSSLDFHISTYNGTDQAVNGWLDEIRIQKGEASFDTSGFTPPTDEYSAAGSTVNQSERIDILDSLQVFEGTANKSDTLHITDSLLVSQPTAIQVEGISITDSLSVIQADDAPFASQIISYNPLIFVTNDNPAKIVKIDTTDPENPIYTTQTLTSGTFATSVGVNTLTGFAYIGCASGIVVKVELNDLTNQTIIDLEDTDNNLKLEVAETVGLVLVTTDSELGELYLIDDRETFIGDTDLSVLLQRTFTGDTYFNSIEVFKGNTDLQVISQHTFIGNCQFNCLSPTVVVHGNGNIYIPPIRMDSVIVYVDNVQLVDTDVKLNTIQIVHTIDEKSKATFTITRRHDRINTTLSGGTSQITGQNDVRIEINGRIEFPKDGVGTAKISSYNCVYGTTDQIDITCEADQPTISFAEKRLSLPDNTHQKSVYHVIAHTPNVLNPYISSEEQNPSKYKGIFVPLGHKVEQSLTRFTEFDSFGTIAQAIQAGDFNTNSNRTYFWSPTIRRFGNAKLKADSKIPNAPANTAFHTFTNPNFVLPTFSLPEFKLPVFKITGFNSPFQNLGQVTAIYAMYVGTSLSPVTEDLWILVNAKHRWQRIFEDKVSRIGTGFIRQADIAELNLPASTTDLWNALQSASYINGSGTVLIGFKLNIFQSEDLNINYSETIKNALYDLLDESFGIYVGSAPFKRVSARNGVLVSAFRWEDANDGLYSVKDAAYNFISYCQRVANLEYQKLLNINGTILPDTSTAIDITVDSYYYQDLRLLNRVNIDNTTEVGIFVNNTTTSFPVAIKSINISMGDMKVTLQADNQKSSIELEAIDGQFPNEDDPEFNEKEQRILIAPKSNLKSMLPVE